MATAEPTAGDTDEARVRRDRAELASMIAHEVRNPIASIRGLAATGVQLYDKLSDQERREFFELIDQEARRLGRMAEEISTAMKLDAGVLSFTTRPQPVAPIVREAAEAIDRGGRLLHIDAEESARSRIDPGRLAELVGHLVENAVKFSPPDASIGLRIAVDGPRVLIDVQDGGPGIPPERREEAFGRFVRFRPPGYEDVPGAGLGLHISRGLAAAQGGTISVTDGPSGGTMLRVSIPLADEPHRDEPTTSPGTGHEPGEVAP